MTLIVNLSATHTLLPISNGIDAFAKLYNHYNPSCGPQFWKQFTGKMWATWQLKRHEKTLIIPYKSGQIDTPTFLAELLKIFNFLETPTEGRLLSEEELNAQATELLTEAWNEIIQFQPEDVERVRSLLNSKEHVYLISNSNELNIKKYITFLRQHFPTDIYPHIDASPNFTDNSIIQIGSTLSLCVSYRFHAAKTATDNIKYALSTMSLINQLVTSLPEEPRNITVISQFAKDLDEARTLGLLEENIHTAEKYFHRQAATHLTQRA